MRGPDRVNCDRGHGVETATNDKIIAPIYESDGKKFKMDSEFLLFKRSTATSDHLELYWKKIKNNVFIARCGQLLLVRACYALRFERHALMSRMVTHTTCRVTFDLAR